MSRATGASVVVIVFCALAGCDGLLDQMGRVLADPNPKAPLAASFVSENRIDLSWDTDAAAEQYILEKAPDALSPTYSVVYQGTGTSFTDTDCTDQARFLYRLSMARGERVFGPSQPVMGVGSAACRDELEPNDAEASATPLEFDRMANLYFYRSYAGLSLQDWDWYWVSVPPRRKANIVITQSGLAGGTLNTFMYFSLKGTLPAVIVNNQAIPVVNSSYETKVFRFKISPNPDEFISDPTLAGGSFINYTVSLLSITGM